MHQHHHAIFKHIRIRRENADDIISENNEQSRRKCRISNDHGNRYKQTFFHPVILFGAEILSGKSRCRQTNTLHRQNIKTVDFIVCRTSGHRIRTKTVNAALYNDI